RHCGGERRRQDDAREALVPVVSADQRAHPRRRGGPGAHATRHVAVAPLGCVSGLFPVRVPGTSHRGRRRPATPRRPACRGVRGSDGRITILVSERFSTVRMADFIVVLRGSCLIESGTHEALMTKGGHYAELYRIQAAAYR